MRDALALRRYLQRHSEANLPHYAFTETCWHQVLILPAYQESTALLEKLKHLPASDGEADARTLVILVLNRPDTDSDPLVNADIRDALKEGTLPRAMRESVSVFCLNPYTDLYLYDMEILHGPTPNALGVGLARKTGCDLALQWSDAGGISGEWLCSADADATLPQDYFKQLQSAKPNSVACTFPFRHTQSMDEACTTATALYELRLHHYVLGLEYAGSPYAYHTLGSCLAIRSSAYAHAHGFPKRAGAEDFYLLNKLAKLGPVARLQGRCIELESRNSSRVPFGTGPAVAKIIEAVQPDEVALFYHPECFTALKGLLGCLPALAEAYDQGIAPLLIGEGINGDLALKAQAALAELGIAAALTHCQKQSRSSAQFQRHFHQWFDGFRTLKFIHALRDSALPMLSLAELSGIRPRLWPIAENPETDIEELRNAIYRHWKWH
jgi:hypothetical protein